MANCNGSPREGHSWPCCAGEEVRCGNLERIAKVMSHSSYRAFACHTLCPFHRDRGVENLASSFGQRALASVARDEDPYAILGLQQGATADAAKLRYRELAKALHPDVARARGMSREEAEDEFKRINRAFEQIHRQRSAPAVVQPSHSTTREGILSIYQSIALAFFSCTLLFTFMCASSLVAWRGMELRQSIESLSSQGQRNGERVGKASEAGWHPRASAQSFLGG